jgi:hypothetical protein
MVTEIWVEIPGKYFYTYQVSNIGRVCRIVKNEKIILNQTVTQRGYLNVNLYLGNKKCKFYRVHTLVILCFLGVCPKGYETHHKNNRRTDNHLANLEYLSHGDNIRKSFADGLHPSMLGLDLILSKETASLIIKDYESGDYTHKQLAVIYNVSRATIQRVVTDNYFKKDKVS